MPRLSVERIAIPGEAGATSSASRISIQYAVAFGLVGILGQFEASAQERAVSAAHADVEDRVTSADLIGKSPAEVFGGGRMLPKRVTPADVVPKPTGASVLLKGRGNVDLTPGKAEGTMDATDPGDVLYISNAAEQAEENRILSEAPWHVKLNAAVDENWVTSMIVRGMERETYDGDPAWHKKYVANQDEYEAMAASQDELDDYRSSRGQNSEQDFRVIQQEHIMKRRRQEIIDSGGNGWAWRWGTKLFDPVVLIVVLVLGLILFRGPIRRFRLGRHLTRMTNIFEAIERTRGTMFIGAGGGIDSLPLAAQRRAETVFEKGLKYLQSYPRHEVTRELAKNARLADAMGRSARVLAINRLIESLSQSGVALGLDDFAKSYA